MEIARSITIPKGEIPKTRLTEVNNHTAHAGEFRPQELPFLRLSPRIPLHEERQNINPELEHTTDHEWNHALVGLALGHHPIGMSLIRRGNVLGTTSFAGDISDSHWAIIAAGGRVATRDGTAKGHGSDDFQILKANVPLDLADAGANSIVNSIPVKFREKLTKISAPMGSLTQSDIQLVMKQAALELELEKVLLTEKESQAIQKLLSCPLIENVEYISVIETYPEVDKYIKYHKGKIISEIVKCRDCGEPSFHKENCIYYQQMNNFKVSSNAPKK